MSATCLAGAPLRATKVCTLAHSHMYLDFVHQSVGTTDNKGRPHQVEAICLRMRTVNAGACHVEATPSLRGNMLACKRPARAMDQVLGSRTVRGKVVDVQLVAQTASDDSMELRADNGIVLVPEALSKPVISANAGRI